MISAVVKDAEGQLQTLALDLVQTRDGSERAFHTFIRNPCKLLALISDDPEAVVTSIQVGTLELLCEPIRAALLQHTPLRAFTPVLVPGIGLRIEARDA